ncbi:MAG: hypothetical protein ABL989_04650 [Gammaproteobacteria bacterium]
MIINAITPVRRARLTPALVLLTAALSAALAAGCSQQVAVKGAYGPGIARSSGFTNLLVLGVAPDINGRCAFEQALAADLRSESVKATMSCSVMSTKEPITRESVERAVATLGADAVVATALVDSSAKVKEGGSADARGGGYYKATGIGYDYGYYGAYGVPVVYAEFETAPSVFSISGTARLSTRVFETRDATLLYTMETNATRLPSREMAIAEISPAIADRLRKDGLVR